MAFDISNFTLKINRLRKHKTDLIRNHERQIAEIDAEIAEEEKALKKISEVLEPYKCKACDGTGEETCTDASGSREHKKCGRCNGIGVRMD